MIRSVALQGRPVITEAGKRLGHVYEIHIQDGEVATLTCGGRGLLQRFWPSRGGHTIRWSKVRRIGEKEIVVADDFASRASPTKGKAAASAKRGR